MAAKSDEFNRLHSYLNPNESTVSERLRFSPRSFNLEKILDEAETTISDRECSENTETTTGSSKNSNTTQNSDAALVYLRIRPTCSTSNLWNYRVENKMFIAGNVENPNTKNKDTTEKCYTFSDIFDRFSQQSEVYNKSIKPLISLDESATIMVYGTSGSGKTHTLLGSPLNPGIAPRAILQIFTELHENISQYPSIKQINGMYYKMPNEQYENEVEIKNSIINLSEDNDFYSNEMIEKIKNENGFVENFIENTEVNVWISFVEIYNEEVFDLLDTRNLELHEIKENKNSFNKLKNNQRARLKVISNSGNAFVKDVKTIFVCNADEAFKILEFGLDRVSKAPTNINSNSTRSHCIFFIDVIKMTTTSGDVSVMSYKFCDLAGSERLKKTDNFGTHLKEAKNINKSLMTLGRCLTSAQKKQNSLHKNISIPVRDSKLTMILQNALLGHEKISLIVNINPDIGYLEENINALNFATTAKEIIRRNNSLLENKKRITRYSFFSLKVTSSPVHSFDMDPHKLVRSLQDQVSQLEEIIESKNAEIEEMRKNTVKREIEIRKQLLDASEVDYKRIENLYAKQVEVYKTKYLEEREKSSFYENENIILRRQVNELRTLNDSTQTGDDSSDEESDCVVVE